MSTTKAYSGSCHCGFVQYQVRLTFPPTRDPNAPSTSIYKCNCSTCQKMGFFHCRPASPEGDFVLVSPTNLEELGDYRVYSKTNGWYFCQKCGVRVFGVGAVWESANIDLEKWAASGKSDGEGKLQPVLRTKPTTKMRVEDGKEVAKPYHYVSVNAVTLEPGEEIDLRMWHEKGWIFYVECRDRKDAPRFGEPHQGGMY